jgi:isochorismate pyruvate lyase
MTHPSPAGNESLPGIRTAIDRIDGDIINLIAIRQRWVEAAGKAKALGDGVVVETVDAPARVQQVIDVARAKAAAAGASEGVVEATYRAMIGAFIEHERGVHRAASKQF